MKILTKLLEPLGRSNLKEFSIKGNVLYCSSFHTIDLFKLTEKVTTACLLICTAVKIKN